ncbi:flagellar hook protein FlgE [Bradyrhizobium elkanii]|uniref:flagellar hook protein FlgE n=1 Tax=Bradyrhizobium elkanii TaxID=29448 RepID=UPI0022280DD9|nr:flagellar hook-basal body complex protein [Bradyrhizobium elkanii]MCW2122456.1 flagellar hook protein FlgE [Bradyrhizobium elkanii]
MGIFGALTTAVGGLRAGSYALENISGNIANSQTTAFKRIDTSFLDLVPQTALTAQLAGGVTAQSRSTNSVQGDVQSASVATFMAINGNGFFAVQKPGSFTDGAPVFDGVDRYTRRGDFQLNKDGYLVNGAGYYLEGVPIDPTTGNPAGSSPQVLQFKNDFLPAQQTTKIDYRANLASYPLTTAHDTSVPGSELIRPGAFSSGNNPLVLGTPAAPYTDSAITGTAQNNKATPSVAITAATLLSGAAGTDSINTNFSAGSAGPPVVPADTITVNGTVITFVASGATGNQLNVTDSIGTLLAKIDAITGTTTPSTISGGKITLHSGTGQVIGNDNSTFLNESVSGGAVTAYDVSGAPVNLQFRWAKTDSSSLGSGHTDTWNLFYQVNPNATGTQVSWQNVNVNFTFASNGQMSPAISSVALTNAVVNGVSLGSPVINFGSGGVTQFADANGNVQVNQIQQDGFPAGQLQSVSVSTNGRIVGNYTNGRNIDLAEISVATFNGTNFLKRIDGGAFEATDESGAALFGKAGTIVGSSLESSNTDIADEFTKLIVTQQAYSANTKVITTTNSMVQDLLNVVR